MFVKARKNKPTVTFRLNILADAEVARSLLDERVLILSACFKPEKIMLHTFGAFFEEDFAPGKGAGAVFFPFGAYEAQSYHHVPLAVIERRGIEHRALLFLSKESVRCISAS